MKVIIILSLEHKMVPQTKVTLKEQSITFLLLFFFSIYVLRKDLSTHWNYPYLSTLKSDTSS